MTAYFGPKYRADQGNSRRFKYFRPLIEAAGGAKTILEVGAWAGASLAAWDSAAESKAKLLVIDFWQPYFPHGGENYDVMTDAAKSGEIFDLFNANVASCGMTDRVEVFRGDSKVILPALASIMFGQIDVAFIDGDHRYEGALADIKNTACLIREGGILCGDDLELTLGGVSDLAAHRRAIDRGDDVDETNKYHPGVTQAVADVFGTVSVFEGLWAVQKVGNDWKEVRLT